MLVNNSKELTYCRFKIIVDAHDRNEELGQNISTVQFTRTTDQVCVWKILAWWKVIWCWNNIVDKAI